MSHTETKVTSLPDCDICRYVVGGQVAKAAYDGKTKPGITHGQWADMCEAHFEQYGVGLGLGQGQKLVPEEPEPRPASDEAAACRSALEDVLGDDEDAIQAEMEDFGYA